MPILLLFAAYAGAALCRQPRATIGAAIAVLGLVVLLNSDLYRLNASIFGSQALSYLDLGAYRMRQGELAEAKALLAKAVELDPGHPAPHALLGRIALEEGRLEEAEKELRLATRGDPVLFRDVITQAQRDLGRLAIQRGWFDRARDRLRAVARARSGERRVACRGRDRGGGDGGFGGSGGALRAGAGDRSRERGRAGGDGEVGGAEMSWRAGGRE